jgi:hypothetical protein
MSSGAIQGRKIHTSHSLLLSDAQDVKLRFIVGDIYVYKTRIPQSPDLFSSPHCVVCSLYSHTHTHTRDYEPVRNCINLQVTLRTFKNLNLLKFKFVLCSR